MVFDIAVIGAGPMGLACAHHLTRSGHRVMVYESDERIGGMSASLDLDGMTIERYYHFICRTDHALFALFGELGLADEVRWADTRMGFYFRGALHPWGNPWALLRFPYLGFFEKLRYARHVMHTKSITDWKPLDEKPASRWIKEWIGEAAWNILWERLFSLKFYEYREQLSAAWIGTRIKRIALSRRSILQESLGYLEGGSERLLRALEEKIVGAGGTIRLGARVNRILVRDGRASGVRVNDEDITCDRVVSTAPLPEVLGFAPDLPAEELLRIGSIANIGVVCPVFKLSRRLTKNFWLNINDPEIAIPGLIEYSNLNPLPYTIVYVPFYLPVQHDRFTAPDDVILSECEDYFSRLNPNFKQDWVIAAKVSRYRYAQTVCPPGFSRMLPPMRSGLPGLLMADTAYYYPEDRSMTESVAIGKTLAALAGASA